MMLILSIENAAYYKFLEGLSYVSKPDIQRIGQPPHTSYTYTTSYKMYRRLLIRETVINLAEAVSVDEVIVF
jgi:hypothetical protein